MEESMTSLRKTARLAGLLYLVLALTGFYGLMYVPSKTIVRDDAVATADRILRNEFLFRAGIVAHIASAVTFLLLAVVLYRLFRGVNVQRARMLAVLVAVQVPIVIVLESFKLTALVLLKGEVFKTLPVTQAQEAALLLLRMHGNGITVLELFWGLWLLPFAQLVYHSHFMPRILGLLLLLAGIGYAIDSMTILLFPAYHPFTQKAAFAFSALGELSVIGWLLIKGVKSGAAYHSGNLA